MLLLLWIDFLFVMKNQKNERWCIKLKRTNLEELSVGKKMSVILKDIYKKKERNKEGEEERKMTTKKKSNFFRINVSHSLSD